VGADSKSRPGRKGGFRKCSEQFEQGILVLIILEYLIINSLKRLV
jgi:hypothetical protein